MPAAISYTEPFFWWGPAWARADWRSIGDLLRDGTIDPGDAALLWAALARRRSMAVIAGPSGAGKSTLLGGLLDLLPLDTRPLYLRGSFETFAFLSDPAIVPEGTALVVNEISPHLPVYLWGSAVDRLLDTTARGFMVLATAHAASVPAFVGLLSGPPLRIAAPRVALFALVVQLELDSRDPPGRRVRGIWRLRPERHGVAIEPLSACGLPTREGAALYPGEELAARATLLRRLRAGEIGDARQLHALAARELPLFSVEPA